MKGRFVITLLALALSWQSGPAAAEDIDLFAGKPSESSDKPNVLFVIDNAADFSSSASGTTTCKIAGATNSLSGTTGGIEQCALYNVINSLPAESVSIGIMLYNGPNVQRGVKFNTTDANLNCNPSKAGGCLVYPISLMTDAEKTKFINWINTWKTSGSAGPGYVKASNENTGASMQEAWAYYKGKTGLSGDNYAGKAPVKGQCLNNYVIFIGNAFSSNSTPADANGPLAALTAAGGNATKILGPIKTVCSKPSGTSFTFPSNTTHETQGYYTDEWARFMLTNSITTYTIGLIDPVKCASAYEATLISTAKVGGGKYYATKNLAELQNAIQAALSEIQAINSVFASVSLPVSVNTEGTYLNQVYIGMFRPEATAAPRWLGNLKQYRLGLDNTGQLKLYDSQATPQLAINYAGTKTGFIAECALSYWTPAPPGGIDSYWALNAVQTCLSTPAESNSFDGNIVEKGAQGQALRGSATATSISRTIKTCSSSACTGLGNFDSANTAVTKLALANGDATAAAAMTDTDRTNLIDWARGLNNRGDETYVNATAMRPSVHGDVVHSRPAAINFGTDASPKVVVFYGGNDGVLRAVNGNRATSFGGAAAGSELWSFIAPEFYGYIKRIRDNSPVISFESLKSTPTTPTPEPKRYGFDGPMEVYRNGSTAWLYATQRRGGRAVYAFDVSNIATSPSGTTLKWRRGCDASGGSCSTGFDDIGQTWSTPQVMKTSGYPGSGATPTPLLIMGGGYDTCEDADPNTCDGSSKGNRIYVLDADDGTLKKTFSTIRGVIGDIFVVTDDSTGLALWAYAADLGGNIYRISGASANEPFGLTAPASWTITKIASLGCDTVAVSCSPTNRKFMFAPDVVEEDGIYYLMLGSGDREKPLGERTATPGDPYWPAAFGTTNYFFMVKDKPTEPTWLSSEFSNCGSNVICLDSLLPILSADNPDPDDLASKKGWYLGLRDHEQVVTSAITVYGITTFSTHVPHVPSEAECKPERGTARVYNIMYADASIPTKIVNGVRVPSRLNRSAEIAGGGLPPSPVAGQVTLDNGKTVPFIIGADPNSPLEGSLPPSPATIQQPKGYQYWFIRK